MNRLLVLTYNVRRSLFQQGAKTFFSPQQFQLSSGQKVAIVPVVTNLGDNIEFRAKELVRLIPNVLRDHDCETCDLVSFSLSGIDARLALAHFGLNRHARTLITVGSPHLGSRLAWLSERQIFSDRKAEPISRLLGVGLRPFWEVAPDNMKNFNKKVIDDPTVNYFSIGAEKIPNYQNIHLKHFGNYLRNKAEQNFVYENDGVFGHDECIWGQHLVNFTADHTELTGSSKFDDFPLMVSLIEDTVQAAAAKTSEE